MIGYFKSLLLICLVTISTLGTSQNWVQVSSLPDSFNQTHHSFAFSLNNIGYIVGGYSDSGLRDDFYSYDSTTDSWTQLTSFPGSARGFAIGDTWDGKAYFGFGYDGISYLNDLWVFDPASNSWTELEPCPCAPRNHPALIAHNDKIYMGMGNDDLVDMNDWWVYDIPSNSWSQKNNLPSVPRHHPYQFGIGNYVYTGFGHGNGIFNDWFRFDIYAETWLEVASLPAEGRVAGTQFSYNDIGFILSGDGDDHQSMNTGEFWQYDPILDAWQELPAHPGNSRWAPASFIVNGEVYIINGQSFGQYVTEIYKFNLDSLLTVDKQENLNVSIYPNPTSDVVHVDIYSNKDYEINILDINGKLITKTKNQPIIQIQDLTEGVYLFQVKDLITGQKVTQRMIKRN